MKAWQSINESRSYFLVEEYNQLIMKNITPIFNDRNSTGETGVLKEIDNQVIFEVNVNKFYVLKENGNLEVNEDSIVIDEAVKIDSLNYYQLFPKLKIAVKCPCILQLDSNSTKNMSENIDSPLISYSCSEKSSNDSYVLNALFEVDSVFSEEEIIYGIIKSLDSNEMITYELKYIDFQNAIQVNSILMNSKMLTLFTNESTINFILNAKDSVDKKFNDFVNSKITYY